MKKLFFTSILCISFTLSFSQFPNPATDDGICTQPTGYNEETGQLTFYQNLDAPTHSVIGDPGFIGYIGGFAASLVTQAGGMSFVAQYLANVAIEISQRGNGRGKQEEKEILYAD